MHRMNKNGFTLIEVIVVILILAIGMAIAIPNIINMGRRSAITSDARQLKDQMSKARVSAIELSTPILIEFNLLANGTSISYKIAQDLNNNFIVDGTEMMAEITLSNAIITSNNLSLNANGNPIVRWNSRGYPRKENALIPGEESPTNGTISLTGNDVQYNVILANTGNIRITSTP